MSHDHDLLRRHTVLVSTIHLALALTYWLAFGVTIVHDLGPDKWGSFWQNLPTELLRTRAIESIWYMHGQPPLWNVVGALLIKLFGSLHTHVLQVLHIALGTAIAGMCVQIVGRATRAPRLALATGVVIALHPALFLFEAYALYTTAAAFLVTSAAYLLTRAQEDGGERAALAFVAVAVALIMTRSVYHLILLLGVVPLAVLLIGRPTRRHMTLLLTLALIPTAWYGKNWVQHGFFGASSWYGMGLWRTVLFQQDAAMVDGLRESGALSPVVSVEAFALPVAYRRLGYDQESTIPALAANDLHNINVPAISSAYRSSAVELIKASPAQYLRNVLTAYGNFSAPSTDFAHLADNRERLRIHAAVEQVMLGRPLVARLESALGRGYYGSFYFLLFPAVLVLYAFQVTRDLRPRNSPHRMRDDAAPLFMAAIVFYTIVIACAMELGENVRFKFVVEPVFLALSAIVCFRLLAPERRRGAEASPGRSGSAAPHSPQIQGEPS